LSIKNKIEYSKDTYSNSVLIVSKGVLIALIISAVLIILYGLLLSFTSLSESSMPAVITAISTVSIALSGIYVAVKVESRGWLNGALMGLIYMVVLYLISLLFKTGAAFDKFALFRIFMGFVIGALSGIIGINLK
jgi:putative membrane protein (TIGR04086 family)